MKFTCIATLICLLTFAPSYALEVPASKISSHKTESQQPDTFKEEIFKLLIAGDNGELQTLRGMAFVLLKKHDNSANHLPMAQYSEKMILEFELESVDGDPRPLAVDFVGSSISSNPAQDGLGATWASAEPIATFKNVVTAGTQAGPIQLDVSEVKKHLSPETQNFLIFRFTEGDGTAQDNGKGDLYRFKPEAKLIIAEPDSAEAKASTDGEDTYR